MNELLWSFDQLREFLKSDDLHVRRWAVERLTKLFPDQSQEPLVGVLNDPDKLVRIDVLRFVEDVGHNLRLGDELTQALRRADCQDFGRIACTLASIGHHDGLPIVLEHLVDHNRSRKQMPFDEFAGLVPALGVWGGDEARQYLWSAVRGMRKDSMGLHSVVAALLIGGMPEDASGLAATYRSRSYPDETTDFFGGFASAVGASRLLDEVEHGLKSGLDAALERAHWWLGDPPLLSDECMSELRKSIKNDYRGALNAMACESIKLVCDRGEDSTAWVGDWLSGNRPTGYRQRTVITQFTLTAFAANESSAPARRKEEVALGLALLCQLSTDRDDEAAYQSAEDKAAVLLAILSANRETVLDDVIHRVSDLGPEVVPSLVERFDPSGPGWGHIRIARTIERIARWNPGSSDAAIPMLIEAVNNNQGDFMLEACADALSAIGPAAVGQIAPRLMDDDIARKIFLCGALGNIPTEASAQAILNMLAQGEPFDEMHANALLDIGSKSGIHALEEAWENDGLDYMSEYLLVLCEVNGIDHPEVPNWRQSVANRAERLARRRAEFDAVTAQTAPAPSTSNAVTHPSRRTRTISKAERKKRSKDRKMNARKKRK
ncbi:MAG: hypothetical protein Q7T82_01960 [Armatimonadota bacterium]|nr:hypothetical protein [Armatimonadota bacterium]